MKLLKILLAVFVGAFVCPDTYCEGAVKIDVKHDINDLIDAIAVVESNGDPNAYNKSEGAAGLYQIRPIYLKDVNRILGYPKYKLADRYDPEKSRQMVFVYLLHYGNGNSFEVLARIHNGGPRGYKKKTTLRYWQKVKRVMEKK